MTSQRLFRNMKLLVSLLLLLMMAAFAISSVSAIDLVTPANSTVTNNSTLEFVYYLGSAGSSCSLDITGPQNRSFSAPANQSFNSVIVSNMVDGSYEWSVSCDGESSPKWFFGVDTAPPQVTLLASEGGNESLSFSFMTFEDANCSVIIDDSLLDSFFVQASSVITKYYDQNPGNHSLNLSCVDSAGNEGSASDNILVTPSDELVISMDKSSYSLGEPAALSIDAPADANVSIDICPDSQGFVQCISPLITGSFPQTVVLPRLNQSGNYIVDALAVTPRGVLSNSTNFSIVNSMSVSLSIDRNPRPGESAWLTAEAYGGVGGISYYWNLSDGTRKTTEGNNRIEIIYQDPGTYHEFVTAVDDAGNNKSAELTVIVDPVYSVNIRVVDNKTQEPVPNATVTIEGDSTEYRTLVNGEVPAYVKAGTRKFYASKKGYYYSFMKFKITEDTSEVVIPLEPESPDLSVILKEPADGFSTSSDFHITFAVAGALDAKCTLFMGQDDFLKEVSSMTVQDSAVKGFMLSQLNPGTYKYYIECFQDGQSYDSEVRSFSFGIPSEAGSDKDSGDSPNVQETDDFGQYEQEKDLFQSAIDGLTSLSDDELEVVDLLGIRQKLRDAKRGAGNYAREIFDSRYRKDLSADEKDSLVANRRELISKLKKETPVSVKVSDKKVVANYITKDEISSLVGDYGSRISEIAGAPGIDSDDLIKLLVDAQQKYTLTTKLYHVELSYADGHKELYSVVSKRFLYGKNRNPEGGPNDHLLELVKGLGSVKLLTKGSVDDGLITTGAFGTLSYMVSGEVPFSKLESVKTLLVPGLSEDDLRVVTGYSILGLGALKNLANKTGISLSILIAVLIASYLAYYFNLLEQAKLLIYEGGRKPKTHYLRVLINDAFDQLRQGNLDQALMVYKEIKLSYDSLPVPGRNEVYDDIIRLCSELDLAFIKQEVGLIEESLKNNDLSSAVEHYANVEGAFSRLSPDDQRRVSDLVKGLASRLGVKGFSGGGSV